MKNIAEKTKERIVSVLHKDFFFISKEDISS
jgi:hypothetical protein